LPNVRFQLVFHFETFSDLPPDFFDEKKTILTKIQTFFKQEFVCTVYFIASLDD
jgi:hypothetical protein